MKHLQVFPKTVIRPLSIALGLCFFCISFTHAQISGIVFKDFNNNGTQNLPNEIGIRNITVSVFVGTTASPFVTQTDINGNYSFSATQTPSGSNVRVEFTGVGVNNDGAAGGQSKTNVQFLTVPSGGASGVSLGILTNNDYCKVEGTLIFTPCYVNGNALAGGSAGADDAFVSFPYNASGVGGTTGPMPTHIAKASEVGSLWGLDYQGRGKVVITSAVVRRHVGLGPLGTGGIYKFNTVSNLLEPLIDVKTLGIDTGPDPHTDLPADKLLSSEDAASVAAAGTVGIGSIALSADEKTLYMINLYDRKLYSVFVGTPAKTPSISSVKSYVIPNPCSDGDYRPWSVKEYQGKLYLGVVCTSQTAQDSTSLSGTIYQFDPKTGSFSVFYEFPLTYKRGSADVTDECINIRYWKPWTNTFPKACASFFDAERGKTVGFAINPQPLIADIEFDSDGSMIIGLMDRFGLAVGFRALAPIDDGKLYDGFVSGDILRVYYNNGVYEMEDNGKAGPLLGSGVGNGEGFGGGEFYGRDYWKFFDNPAHKEISNGGLMLLPGSGEVLSSAMDPVDEVYHAGGFQIFSNTDGTLLRSFAVYAGKPGTLGKSGGVGDMKAACADPFIELGNRVWNDINKNGVQDPNEEGVDGLTVTLHDMEKGGIEIASTVTAGGGTYIFNNTNVQDTVKYEHHYQIRLKMLQPNLTNQELIEVSIGGAAILPDSVENVAEMRDSDALLVKIPSDQSNANEQRNALRGNALDNNDFAVIDFFTGAYTISNHSLDIGVSGCIPPTDVTASSNSPLSEGSAINFTATSTGGSSYSWSGPNGFASTLQNPSIASATLAMAGIYTVTILSSGTCTATATTAVIVNCIPPTNVTASNNSPISEGSAINFTATSTGGSSYSWSGPNGFASTLQNPSIASATLAMAGIYTVTITGNGTCTATATTNVVVNCVPPTNVTASSNSPVSEGSTINFTATSTGGVSYKWAGPNGFTSNLQNPSIASATLAMAGVYTVTITGNGTCTATATVNVGINCVPPTNVTASNNSPVIIGETINFTATSTGGISYKWAGPNGFTSNLQNPSIASATLAMSGVYTVTIASNGNCISTATTSIIVNCVLPTNITVSNNSPLNVGNTNTINLSATSSGGTTYTWAGPNGFTSNLQNPVLSSSTLAMSGVYTVTVLSSGTCTATATTNVVFLASLGDYAWYDANRNGIQDNRKHPFTGVDLGPEIPTSGARMILYNADTNTPLAATITNNVGFYEFKGLLPGNYYVKFDNTTYPDSGYVLTNPDANINDAVDSDVARVTYRTTTTNLVSGENDTTWDIGFFRTGSPSISDPCKCTDFVYSKSYLNAANPYTRNEGVDIKGTVGDVWVIIKQSGMYYRTTSPSDPLVLIPLGTEIHVKPNDAGAFHIDFQHIAKYDQFLGNTIPQAVTGYNVTVTNGIDTLSIGNTCATLSGPAPKIPDTLCIYNTTPYVLPNLILSRPGVTTYYIPFTNLDGSITSQPITEIGQPNSVPLNYAGQNPLSPRTIIGTYTPTDLSGGVCPLPVKFEIAFGILKGCLAEIGDYVWNDTNKNGMQDVGEKGIPNVSVTLLDGNGVVVTKDAYGNSLLGKTTDANGFYEFIKLPPGDYMVKFGKPTSYTATLKDAVSATDTNDNDADPTTGISQKVTLAQGERNPTIDAGFYLDCVPPTNVTASSNSPVNEGQPINLTATSTGGSGYAWTGPNGYTSNLQNPTIASAATYMAGTYTVTVKSSDNCTTTASTTVSVIQICKSSCIPLMAKKIK